MRKTRKCQSIIEICPWAIRVSRTVFRDRARAGFATAPARRGRLPRLRARRTASTFHRRKVDRKAAGGPFYQRRNAPRSPPLDRGRFCGNAGRHRKAGRARSDGRNHVPPVNPLLFGQRTRGESQQNENTCFKKQVFSVMPYHCRFLNPRLKNAMCKSEFFVLF